MRTNTSLCGSCEDWSRLERGGPRQSSAHPATHLLNELRGSDRGQGPKSNIWRLHAECAQSSSLPGAAAEG
eukprot:13763868-Alexandrium_andersonii.AAC.1